MPFTPPPDLRTPRLQLRAWTPADAPALAATLSASDAHLRTWTPWVVDGPEPGLSLEDRLARHAAAFESGAEWVYGIFLPGSAAVVGGCGLYPRLGPGALEIGYWLAAAHTGRGFATEATAALVHVAFTSPAIERVELHCDPNNHTSVAVPRRLGLTHVTTVAAKPRTAGAAPAVLAVWQLTRPAYEARRVARDLAAEDPLWEQTRHSTR
ncbi:MAG TPA: GNAT family N-acetyltransferase [Gemmatimonadaceae bacterium]|nr:GNAT family N-acetyltransferase [Gemmatimonadaceae bacterium]